MGKKRVVLLSAVAWLLVLATSLWFPSAQAALARNASQQARPVVIYFFWGDGCPHCAEEEPFLKDLAQRYPSVEIRDYEVWYNAENQKLLKKMATAFGFEPQGVPTTFIGQQYWTGFTTEIGASIEAYVAACAVDGCRDAGVGVIPGIEETADAPSTSPETAPAGNETTLTLPILGTVDLATQSLAVSTVLIAVVDGFNPCSLWVLSVLLALALHTGSRKKVLIIGLVFLTVTSLVYVLFIAGLFTLFSFVSFLKWIQVVVSLVALFFAAVNIKDYFWYKEGLSLTISEEKKPGIYKNIRRVLNAGDSLWGMITATVVMSAGVSLVEFACTAGFPVLWTNLLAAQSVSALTFGLLLLLYMVIYQVDELGIFLAAVFTLKSSKLEEKHGRILKLVGGTLMLTLAAVMLINPNLMNNLGTSLLIFAAAFGVAGLVLLAHRVILPHYGIYIGTEARPSKKRRTNRRPQPRQAQNRRVRN